MSVDGFISFMHSAELIIHLNITRFSWILNGAYVRSEFGIDKCRKENKKLLTHKNFDSAIANFCCHCIKKIIVIYFTRNSKCWMSG